MDAPGYDDDPLILFFARMVRDLIVLVILVGLVLSGLSIAVVYAVAKM